jgi:RecA-family ATPase
MTTLTPTEIRLKLRALGYAPIPVSGKRPSMEGWQTKLGVNADEIKLWERLYPYDKNTGVLTGDTPCLDVDIMDEAAAEDVEHLACDCFGNYGALLVRIGKPPKRGIFFRTEQPFKKLSVSLTAPNGMAHKIEFLGDGQQAVVDGVHPETGRPYVWRGGTLVEVRHDELPGITAASARDFLAKVAEHLVREHGYKMEGISKPESVNGPTDDTPRADWAALTAKILTGVELHDSLRDLAASYLTAGVTEDAARRLLETLMLQVRSEQRDNRWVERWREIPRAVRSAAVKFVKSSGEIIREQPSSTEPQQPLPYINMSNWDNEPVPQQEWSVLGRIPRYQTALFSGEGAIGKSTIELHRVAAHVLGRDWLGTMPEEGPAIFIDTEDHADVLHRRLAAITHHYEVPFSDLIRGGLHLISLAGEDAVLATASRSGKVEPTQLYKQILEAAGDIKPVTIGIASSANVFAGNENDRNQVQQFIGQLTRLAIISTGSVNLISHPSLTGIATDTGMSGTTQWHNAVRARMFLRGIKPAADEQPQGDLREIIFKKNQYGPVSENVVLQYRDGMFLPAPSKTSLDQAMQEAKADEKFCTNIIRFMGQGRNVSIKPNAPTYAPTEFAKEPEAKKLGLKKTDFEAAMRRLLEAGKIKSDAYGPPSRGWTRLCIVELE